MKTIVLGDTHGREYWKYVTQTQEFDRLIFIGDYFDTHEDITPARQMWNFKEIINWKESVPNKEVIMLIGNHDYHYFPEIGYTGTSGFQSGAAPSINQLINESRQHLQMAYSIDNFLFTHAGVTKTWYDTQRGKAKWDYFVQPSVEEFINDVWKFTPKEFDFTGWDSSGDNVTQTPIWVRPRSLLSDMIEGIIQVVGHTTVKKIGVPPELHPLWMIDALGTSREYISIEDGQVTIQKL